VCEVKTGFLNLWLKEIGLISICNRFFDSPSCTENHIQLITLDLATLTILAVLQICDALLNNAFL